MTIDLERIGVLLQAGEPVHEQVLGGYLDVERALPVLVIHRRDPADDLAPQLLLGQSSVLVCDRDAPIDDARALVHKLVQVQADAFGAFLMLEVWTVAREGPAVPGSPIDLRIVTGPSPDPQPVEVLHAALEEISIGRAATRVELDATVPPAPPGMEPVLAADDLVDLGCLLLGIEVPALYRADDEGPIYPRMLRVLRARLSVALQKTFFEFIRVHTSYELQDHRELGRRYLVPTGTDADKKLAEIGASLDPLFHMTPINTEAAFRDFEASGYEEIPSFHYRLLPFDPDLVKRELYALPIEDVADPTVAALLREKRLELDRTITLLEDRDTLRFSPGCLLLYPAVHDTLLAEADTILSKVPVGRRSGGSVSPEEFAARAEAEIDLYRAEVPEIDSEVVLRDDMPGIMVSRGHLHLSTGARIGRNRVEALVHHEVGTHIVTYHNGLVQPLRLLSAGLPGYEQTQEGLAMFAEYLSGGLEGDRLRTIAARVVAVDMMTRGADFVEIFRRMHGDLELPARAAWSVTMRVTRGGGSSKDAIYLRGLRAVLEYVAAGHPLEPLLIGKIALEHVPLVEELLWRQILTQPRLQPRWLSLEGAQERLSRARAGLPVTELVEH